MPEKSVVLKSASYEPGGDEARAEHLEATLEAAGVEVVETPAAEGDAAATVAGREAPRKSRRERAIAKATAPLEAKIRELEARLPPEAQVEVEQAADRQWMQQNINNYSVQVEEAKRRYRDWDTVVNRDDVFIGQPAQLALLELDNAADVVYWLAHNTDHAEKLGKMRPISAIREVQRLSSRLSGGSGEGRPKPRVPAPIRAVSTGGSTEPASFAEIAARPNYPGKARDLKRASDR